MPTLRLIGDVHGLYGALGPLLEGPDHFLQVGDLGPAYHPLRNGQLPDGFRAIGGNHDQMERDSPEYFRKQPFFLGDYGLHEVPGFPDIFYVRGAWSIDHAWRQRAMRHGAQPCWWPEEELTQDQLDDAVRLYALKQPNFVVTHEAPLNLVQYVTNPQICLQFGYPAGTIPTRTNQALQRMLDAHRPKLWCWGHYHTRWEQTIEGTRFVCLDMLQLRRSNQTAYLDLTPDQFD